MLSTALLLTLAGLPAAAEPPEYTRYELFELALCAGRVVTGEIRSVGSSTFELRVEERIVGEDVARRLEVACFENWTCAHRWAAYQPGQRVLLFLAPAQDGSHVARILGAGGEGEM